jgi:hypothetical protein
LIIPITLEAAFFICSVELKKEAPETDAAGFIKYSGARIYGKVSGISSF